MCGESTKGMDLTFLDCQYHTDIVIHVTSTFTSSVYALYIVLQKVSQCIRSSNMCKTKSPDKESIFRNTLYALNYTKQNMG